MATIHWFMFGGLTSASSRIRGYQVHAYLKRNGYSSRVFLRRPKWIEMPDIPWECVDEVAALPIFQPGDCAVFQTVRGSRAAELCRLLRAKRVRVVYDECDLLFGSQMPALADELVCGSRFLAQEYEREYRRSATVIEDGIEGAISEAGLASRTRNVSSDLKLVWIGNYSHWSTLETVRSVLQESEFSDFQLVTISDHASADVPWSLAAAKARLKSCDAVVVPTVETPFAMAKSTNRIVQPMAFGAPVLAGRIPAYEAIITPGFTGFFCETLQEWADALRALRNPDRRRKMSERAYRLAMGSFSSTQIGAKWLEVCTRHLGSEMFRRQFEARPRLPWKLRGQEFWQYARCDRMNGRLWRAILFAGASVAMRGGRRR